MPSKYDEQTRVKAVRLVTEHVQVYPSESVREIRELKRKNAELERTVEILKAATGFFARESGPRQR